MNKNKFDLNSMKENFSWVERFTRKYMVETLTVAAIVISAFSAWSHLFLGTLGWSMLFLVVGSAVGIFLPSQMDAMLKKIYSFSRSESHTATIVAEVVKMAIALFVPFVYFGFLGVLAGTAYQYFIRIAQSKNKGSKAA